LHRRVVLLVLVSNPLEFQVHHLSSCLGLFYIFYRFEDQFVPKIFFIIVLLLEKKERNEERKERIEDKKKGRK
jgi:hypothetical protein